MSWSRNVVSEICHLGDLHVGSIDTKRKMLKTPNKKGFIRVKRLRLNLSY